MALYYSRNILEYILGPDRMADLPLNLVVQASLETTLDPNLIVWYSNLGDDDLELGKIVDDITISLRHLLQLIVKNMWFISTIEIRFEYSDELIKRSYRWDTATNRDDISKLSYFGEKGSCYFDFTAFVDNIIDVILYTDYPCINGGKT
jgi:hypothetical protein